MSHELQVTTKTHPARDETEVYRIPEGVTLREALESAKPGITGVDGLRVFVNCARVLRDAWDTIRPSRGAHIYAWLVPATGDADSDKVIRTVLFIGITALSLGVGGGWGAVIQIGGVWGVEQLVPIMPIEAPVTKGVGVSSTPVIGGAKNALNPFGPVPMVLGIARITPPLAALPYTELDGGNQYLRMMTTPGYGPLQLTDFRLGETDLFDFDDVEMELVGGGEADGGMGLFPGTVIETQIGTLIKQTTGWITRRTEAGVDEIGVEFTLPRGLIKVNDDGSRSSRTIALEAQYKEVGAGVWSVLGDTLDVPSKTFASENMSRTNYSRIIINKINGRISVLTHTRGELPATPSYAYSIAIVVQTVEQWLYITDDRDAALTTYGAGHFLATNDPDTFHVKIAAGKFDTVAGFSRTAKTASVIRAGQTIRVENGQYDVRIRRTTADSNDSQIFDEIYWTVMRSITNTDPVNLSNIAKIALRIRASDQLQGMIEDFNCIAWSIMPDWDSTTSAWITRETSNPASVYRQLLQGPMNKRPLANARIDLVALQTWHEWCESNGIEFNGVIDFKTTLYELLQTVAAIGRASPTMRDGKWSVVQDVSQSTPRQLFTPKNSRNYSAQRVFVEDVHGVKVEFIRGLPTHELRVTPANVGIGDVFTLKFNDVTVATFTATAATVANVTAGLKAAWDASSERVAGWYDATDDTTHLTLLGNRPSAQITLAATAVDGDASDDQTLTVTQQNTAGTWEQDEIIVYDDGYDATNASKFEKVKLLGVANEDQAWKTGRYLLAVRRLRPEVHTFEVDVEHIVCNRGDLVRFQHDVPLIGLSTGRVTARTTAGGNVTTITLDEIVTMITGNTYAVRYRQSDMTVLVENVDLDVGDQTTLTFSGAVAIADAPDIGDLVSFGIQDSETVEMIVQKIEMGADLSAKMTLIDAAPGVHTADSGTIPAYNPTITHAPRLGNLTPATPEIVGLRSDVSVMVRHQDGTFENRILATIRPGSGGDVPTARYEAQFKLSALSQWTELPDAPFSATDISLIPVQSGDTYDFRVRAVSQWGIASVWVTEEDHLVIGSFEIGTETINVIDQALALASGTMVNAYVGADGHLFAPIDLTETWTTHFTSRSWTTIQDQIDAGYPYYSQPSKEASASWELKTDLGGLIYDARIVSAITLLRFDGDVTVTPTISVSADDVDYTVFAGSDNVFATGFRYVKVKYEFDAEDDTAFVEVSEIRLTVDAKARILSNTETLAAGDAAGTEISLTEDYTKVTAIVANPKDAGDSTYCVVNYDYATINPTTFKVKMFDEAGARASGTCSFVVRGY